MEKLTAATAHLKDCRTAHDGGPLSPSEQVKVLEAALGTVGARTAIQQIEQNPAALQIPNSKAIAVPALSAAQVTELRRQAESLLRANRSVRPLVPASVAAASAPTTATQGIPDVWSRSVYDIWYRYYARAPWPHAWTSDRKGPQAADLQALLRTYCDTMKLDCSAVSNAVLTEPDKQKPEVLAAATEILEGTIVSFRLAPVAARMCEMDLSHPLCQFPDALRGYLTAAEPGEQARFGSSRWFYPFTSPPRQPPKRTKSYPVEPRQRMCLDIPC